MKGAYSEFAGAFQQIKGRFCSEFCSHTCNINMIHTFRSIEEAAGSVSIVEKDWQCIVVILQSAAVEKQHFLDI